MPPARSRSPRRISSSPAGPVQVAAAHQLVAQRDGIDHVAPLGQGEHGAEQQPVTLAVEHRIVQDFGGLERRVLVEQHGAEHRLLRFVAPRNLATAEVGVALSR